MRKTPGLGFEGGAFDEQYMLGDVEVEGQPVSRPLSCGPTVTWAWRCAAGW
jgi:hypothetical protein